MNKSFKGLLVALVAVGTGFADTSDNNKTALNTRICRDGVPAYTTFGEMKADKNDDRFGGNVELTGFYGRSTNGKHLAKNFGADGGTTIEVANKALIDLNKDRPIVAGDLLLHDCGTDVPSPKLAGILNFDPKQRAYGLRLDYHQDLSKWFDGLYVALNVPFVHVSNDLNMTVKNATDQVDNGTNVTNHARTKLYDLFTGKDIARDVIGGSNLAANNHTALKYAKMCNNSKTGFGDTEALIGWNFLEGSKYHAGMNLTFILPTGDASSGEYLWGARTGEDKWGLGGGLDASAILWEENDQNLKLKAALQYKYLLRGTEKRTLPLSKLRYNDESIVNLVNDPILSSYYLVGEKTKAGLKPLANVSTLNLKVRPGSQLDGTLAVAYNNGGFTLDLGYNMFWKQRENNSLKASCNTTCDTAWTDNKYAVANGSYLATNVFTKADSLAAGTDAESFIQATDLNIKATETHAQLVHKVFIGAGYIAKSWDYPVMIGTGVAFSKGSNNKDAAEGYSFWAKAGVSF